MFSFRNKLSPTTSTMLKLHRSPCTITIHQWCAPRTTGAARTVQHALDLHATLAHDEAVDGLRDAAALRFTIELLQQAIGRLERAGAVVDVHDIAAPPASLVRLGGPATSGDAMAPTAASNGSLGSATALLLGIAGALIAASSLAPKRAGASRIAGHAGQPPQLPAGT